MENIEKVFVIQPIESDNYRSLHNEAVALIESAGGVYCGSVYQRMKEVNPATYIGTGKLQEIAELLNGLDEITVLFNGSLSPSQTLNISSALGDRKVIDRTTLILDIFAKNAVSNEGKVQVELAQLNYIYPRLKGKGSALSRLGGGIGSRGPGETQLETDRRHIRYRIKYLEARLSELEARRAIQSERRSKNDANVIALVGYTNTGKSTLMNLLTGSDVLSKNALFATLDPTARKFQIDGIEFVLIDTVGFLQALPTELIEAFHSTLESALHCDLALIVSDATDDYAMQTQTTLDTLKALSFQKPYLKVLNKCENLGNFAGIPKDYICISAKENLGIETLKQSILSAFQDKFVKVTLLVPYDKMGAFNVNVKYLSEQSRAYTDVGLQIEATIKKEYLPLFSDFIVK
jgi:GTP-binding protein HflX